MVDNTFSTSCKLTLGFDVCVLGREVTLLDKRRSYPNTQL